MTIPTQERTMYDRIHLALDKLGHPDRLFILHHLTGDALSTVELARRRVNADIDPNTDTPDDEINRRAKAILGGLSYHVRAMHKAGLIERTRQSHVRGAIQTFYRPTARGRQLHADLLDT